MFDPRIKGYCPSNRIVAENLKVRIQKLEVPAIWSDRKSEWISLDRNQKWEITFPHDLERAIIIYDGKEYRVIGNYESKYFTIMDDNGDIHEVYASKCKIIKEYLEHKDGSGYGYLKNGMEVRFSEKNGIWTAKIIRL